MEKKGVRLRGRAQACRLVGETEQKHKSLIFTPLFSSPFTILRLWLFPFFFPLIALRQGQSSAWR